MLVPHREAAIISRIIYQADCTARFLITNQYNYFNERAYMGAFAGLAARDLIMARYYFRHLGFRIDVRDRHLHDGIFIFRVANEVKIGLCESKILRFYTPTRRIRPLTTRWDRYQPADSNESHFFKQLNALGAWPDCIATWIMFIQELNHNQHSPPLDDEGSSCVWHRDLTQHILNQAITLNHRWTLQDVIDIDKPPLTNLQDIIYKILTCKAGQKIIVDSGYNNVRIDLEDNSQIVVPLPFLGTDDARLTSSILIDEFLKENKLMFYNFYDLTELVLGETLA